MTASHDQKLDVIVPISATALSQISDWFLELSEFCHSDLFADCSHPESLIIDGSPRPETNQKKQSTLQDNLTNLLNQFLDLLSANPVLCLSYWQRQLSKKSIECIAGKERKLLWHFGSIPTLIDLQGRLPSFLSFDSNRDFFYCSEVDPSEEEGKESQVESNSGLGVNQESSNFVFFYQLIDFSIQVFDSIPVSSELIPEESRIYSMGPELGSVDSDQNDLKSTLAACGSWLEKHDFITSKDGKPSFRFVPDWAVGSNEDEALSRQKIDSDGKVCVDQSNWDRTIRQTAQLIAGIKRVLRFRAELQNEKFNITRDLVYGASHEINNPLANIASRAQRLMALESDEKKKDLASVINAQAFRGFEMLANMMFYAKPPSPSLESVDFVKCCNDSIDRMTRMFKEDRIELDVRFSADSLTKDSDRTIKADPKQLETLLDCLIKNSVESYSHKTSSCPMMVTLQSVSTNALDTGLFGKSFVADSFSSLSETYQDSKEPGWIALSISDLGQGIGDLNVDQLFHPYFSGREAGRGLGFGLAKVFRIVESHNGHILWLNHSEWVSNAEGCTVIVLLPISQLSSLD